MCLTRSPEFPAFLSCTLGKRRAVRVNTTGVGLKTNLWDGKSLSAFIQDRYAVPLGVRQCQRLFRRLVFRLRKPRPLVAHADPERQREYKKNSEDG